MSVSPCSAYVLPLPDVIKHLFTEPLFARFAGVRTQGMIESPFYARLDAAHGGAISAFAVSEEPRVDPAAAPAAAAVAEPPADPPADAHMAGDSDFEDDPDFPAADPDPRDEVMTGNGDTLVLMFGLFCDGVQLHESRRSSTTVFSLKCLDLPGFLVGTNLASYNIAFIDGPKEPTCMTDILLRILAEFKELEPLGITDDAGARCDPPPDCRCIRY